MHIIKQVHELLMIKCLTFSDLSIVHSQQQAMLYRKLTRPIPRKVWFRLISELFMNKKLILKININS